MDIKKYNELKARGITLPPGMEIMASRTVNGVLKVDPQATLTNMRYNSGAYAMDAAMNTLAPSIGGPSMFYNVLSPTVVDILFNAMKATDVLPARKEGSATDEVLNIRVREFTGGTTAYNDFTNGITSDVNDNYAVRQPYRYKTTIMYGNLEVAKAGARRVSLVAEKQEAAAFNMAYTENLVYLRGVQGIKLYGFLNDPNMNAPINALTAVTPAGNKTKWTDKVMDPTGNATHISNDVMALWQELQGNNGGHIDPSSRVRLVLSQNRISLLNRPNNFGRTALSAIMETLPNIELVALPECSLTEGERMYMIIPEATGQEAGYMAFAEKLNASPVIQDTTYAYQSFDAMAWGAIITNPRLISCMTGI